MCLGCISSGQISVGDNLLKIEAVSSCLLVGNELPEHLMRTLEKFDFMLGFPPTKQPPERVSQEVLQVPAQVCPRCNFITHIIVIIITHEYYHNQVTPSTPWKTSMKKYLGKNLIPVLG